MTHDELLAKIELQGAGLQPKDNPYLDALRAVVELHKPWDKNSADGIVCWDCEETYPCPTIQAIEKELG